MATAGGKKNTKQSCRHRRAADLKKLYGTILNSIKMVCGGKVTDQVTLHLAKVIPAHYIGG